MNNTRFEKTSIGTFMAIAPGHQAGWETCIPLTRESVIAGLVAGNEPLLAALAAGAVPFQQLHEGAAFRSILATGQAHLETVWHKLDDFTGRDSQGDDIRFEPWELVIPVEGGE